MGGTLSRGGGGEGLSFRLTGPERHPPGEAILRVVREWLEAYCRGDAAAAPPLPVDFTRGAAPATPHRTRVWAALAGIPFGETRTYGDIARAAETGARAAGNACGTNPVPLIIPCHRVLGAGGRLGGFSGCLECKRRLLAHEGVAVAEPRVEGAPARKRKREVGARAGAPAPVTGERRRGSASGGP